MKSAGSLRKRIASMIVNIGAEVCIILLTDAVVYIIPIFWKILGKIIVNIPNPRNIVQSFLVVGILFYPYFTRSNIIIGTKTTLLNAPSVIGGTPSSKTILIKGNEKDKIKIADSTIMK